MEDWDVGSWLTADNLRDAVAAVLVLVGGLLVARAAAAGTVRLFGARLEPQQRMLVRRAVFYPLAGLVLVSVLQQLDFIDLSVFLGAAGILTVALGFASQTAASNVISGLFLLGERPFVVGEVIEVGGTTGEVVAINWVSARLRTFDNRLVRIPNETLLKTEIVNLTRHPLRRIDVKIGVGYGSDLAEVRRLLLDAADRLPLCLDEPKPTFQLLGFGESSLDVQLAVWGRRESFLELSTAIRMEVKRTLDEAGVEIPFPHRRLVASEVTVRAAEASPAGGHGSRVILRAGGEEEDAVSR